MVDVAELTGDFSYYIIRHAISIERLKELRVRVLKEDDLPYGGEAEEEGRVVPCYAITATGIKKLVKAGYKCDRIITLPELDNVKFVALANPDDSPARADVDPKTIKIFEISNFDGRFDREKLRVLVQDTLGKVVDSHFRLHVPHSQKRAPTNEEGWIEINIWSSPDDGQMECPEKMWGINVSCCDNANIGPWISGNPVITEEGDEVGAFDKHNIYLYWDAVEHNDENSEKILRKFFEFVAKYWEKGSGFDKDIVCKQYVKHCKGRAAALLREMERDYDDLCNRIVNNKEKMIRDIREARRLEVDLVARRSSDEALEKQLRKEFEALCAIPHVRGVNWRGDNLTVTTDVLYCQDPRSKKWHEIGAFNLVVDQNSSEVRFYNLTRQLNTYENGMHGPHLFPTGRACMGNMQEILPRLVANYEWSAAVEVAIAFVQSVNVDDSAGRHINAWPEAKGYDPKKDLEEKLAARKEVAVTATVAADAVPAATD